MEKVYQKAKSNPLFTLLVVGSVLVLLFIVVGTIMELKRTNVAQQPNNTNMSNEKFKKTFLSEIPIDDLNETTSHSITNTSKQRNEPIPDYYDLRETGFVGKALNQGNCTMCSQVSVFQTMEITYAIQKKKFTKLSYEDALQKIPGMKDCKMENVIKLAKYMEENNITLSTEECYPNDAQCNTRVGIRSVTNDQCLTSDEITRKIYEHGPLIAVVNALIWKYYSGNARINEGCSTCDVTIYSTVPSKPCCGCCRKVHPAERRKNEKKCGEFYCSKPYTNHVVPLIGYNNATKSGDVPYYIVLNSWGDFTEEGIIRIGMGNNVCGIESSITYFDVIEYSNQEN